MAVEKMYMLNVVGKLDDLENIGYEVLKSKSIDMVDAMTQLSRNNAIYNLNEKDIEMIVDLNGLAPFDIDKNIKKKGEEAREIMDYLAIEELDKKSLDFKKYSLKDFDKLYGETADFRKEIEEIHEKLEESEKIKENLALFENVDVDLKELKNMEFFTARFGRLEKSARL